MNDFKTLKQKIKNICDSLSYRLNAVSLNRRKLYVVLIFLVGVVILLLNIFIPRALSMRSSNKNEPNSYPAQTDTVSSINSTTTQDVDDFRFGF